MSNWENWNIWSYEENPLPEVKTIKTYNRISICTTCMGRLYDLAVTLPKNIEDNKDYPNVEFVVVDYNSDDNVGNYLLNGFPDLIESGKLVHVRTEEPKFFSMAHSRNIAFKVASGDIVNNVDADNFTGKGFATAINQLAQLRPERALFAKGKRSVHGRIGFWRNEFIDILGGYDEELKGYGHDDHDLMERAMRQDFALMWWHQLGKFDHRLKTPRNIVGTNMENSKWRETEKINKEISAKKLAEGKLKANEGIHWGKAKLIKNGIEEIEI
jgi:hypothetical protein